MIALFVHGIKNKLAILQMSRYRKTVSSLIISNSNKIM